MLKVADLAGRADFDAGPLRISPGRRRVDGPAGSAHVEPIVMKVFMLLLDAAGSVVTRDELFDRAWGGVFVGDDSLNRAIARVRKIAAETAPGLFEIETIPRTGYRVTGAILDQLDVEPQEPGEGSGKMSRRAVVGVGTASLVAAAGAGVWTVSKARQRRYDELLQQAQAALELNDGTDRASTLLRQAVAARPQDARAQGLLAFALVENNDDIYRKGSAAPVVDADAAAIASLRLDPNDANARLARVILDRSTLDFAATEDRLRAVLATAPRNVFVMRNLWNMLQTVGRSHDAMDFVQRAIAISPMAASSNFPLAQLLWITGRTAAADRVIDRAMQFWPDHPFVRFARFTIFAFTGRASAALAMLDSGNGPQAFTPASAALWRISLQALDNPTAANVDKARAANLAAVKKNPGTARQALLVLPALNQLDVAFDIANTMFLYERSDGAKSGQSESTAWRFAPFLFVPPTASLRADSRFAALADGIGLTAYWEKRGIRPDYQLARA